MRDITHKVFTLRKAIATSIVKMQPETLEALKTNTTTPKKDILPTSRAAGYLAVKNTPQVIPHCHPLPIEDVTVDFEYISDSEIKVFVEVQTIYKTGVEVEAMHGASIVALTIYDMLKPMDKKVEILLTKLESKSGGKTDYRKPVKSSLRTAVVVMSDSIASGKKEDKAGKSIIERFDSYDIKNEEYIVIPDEPEKIKETIQGLVEKGIQLIVTSGGTGLSPRDVTPETIQPMFTKEIGSLMEAARSYGQLRTPYSMLSRGVAGFINESLVLTFPGSSKGTRETLDALFPYVFHIFKVRNIKYKHEDVDNK